MIFTCNQIFTKENKSRSQTVLPMFPLVGVLSMTKPIQINKSSNTNISFFILVFARRRAPGRLGEPPGHSLDPQKKHRGNGLFEQIKQISLFRHKPSF